jgi:hypothetical protein
VKDHQLVKLLYRRKPGVKNGEYQGVLAIKCKDKTEANSKQVSVTAALVHNVPVIIRTGRLPIKASFLATKVINDTLQVSIKIDGNRSLTGNLELINSASGETILEHSNVSIYAQQPVKDLAFSIHQYKNIPLMIKFTENSKFGGELVIQQSLN